MDNISYLNRDNKRVIKVKKIIQVVQHLRPGGIETLSLDLASFSAADEQVFIVSLEGDLESALLQWPRLTPYKDQLIFMNKQPGVSTAIVSELITLFKQLDADTVHSHHIGPLLYAGLAARLAGIRHFIHTEHDAWHLSNFKRRAIQKCALTCLQPKLVADAETVAANMHNYLGESTRINVINNGIDTQYFIPGDKVSARQALGLPSGVTLIGCGGRLETVKGQQILIQAMQHLPQFHLALAGIGTLEQELRDLTVELGLTDRVHFLGRIDDMPTFYQALDLFCLPSLNEGFPLSPLEAQACNIEAIVTDVGGAKETLCPNTGALVPANNVKQLAMALFDTFNKNTVVLPREYITAHNDVRVMTKAYASLR